MRAPSPPPPPRPAVLRPGSSTRCFGRVSADLKYLEHTLMPAFRSSSQDSSLYVHPPLSLTLCCAQIYLEEFAQVKGHFGPINSVAFHPSGSGFVTGGFSSRAAVKSISGDALIPCAPQAARMAMSACIILTVRQHISFVFSLQVILS